MFFVFYVGNIILEHKSKMLSCIIQYVYVSCDVE